MELAFIQFYIVLEYFHIYFFGWCYYKRTLEYLGEVMLGNYKKWLCISFFSIFHYEDIDFGDFPLCMCKSLNWNVSLVYRVVYRIYLCLLLVRDSNKQINTLIDTCLCVAQLTCRTCDCLQNKNKNNVSLCEFSSGSFTRIKSS